MTRIQRSSDMATLTVTSKGQVTLRKDFLQHLGVAQGQRLELSKLPGGRLEIRAARAEGGIDRMFGLLAGKSRKAASLKEIDDAIAAGWAGRK
jgi:antitoxin PrlF